MSFELNDGTSINIGEERFAIPESLFKPSALLGQQPALLYDQQQQAAHQLTPTDPLGEILENTTALQQLTYESIMRCDPDVRKELFACTILTGGTSLLPGLSKRFEKELVARAPSSMRVKAPLTAAALPVERKFSVWLGGSILASLGTFQPLWVSRKDWLEFGAGVIHRI
jgi:actin-related protein